MEYLKSNYIDVDKALIYLQSIGIYAEKENILKHYEYILNNFKIYEVVSETLVNKSNDIFLTEMSSLPIDEDTFLTYSEDCFAVIFIAAYYDKRYDKYLLQQKEEDLSLIKAVADIILEINLTEIAQRTAYARVFDNTALTQGFFITEDTTSDTLKKVCEIPKYIKTFKGILIGVKQCFLKNQHNCNGCGKSGHCKSCKSN